MIRARVLQGIASGLILGLTLALSGTAGAIVIDPNERALLRISNGFHTFQTQFGLPLDSEGNFAVELTNQQLPSFSFDIAMSGNIDPFIEASFSILNTLGSTADFEVQFFMPIAPVAAPTDTGGSTSLTVSDAGGGGATMGNHFNGRPSYFSRIDGTDYVSLNFDPFSAAAFQQNTVQDAFGTPIPSLFNSGGAAASLGIHYAFSITDGDRANGDGIFVVEPAPEPTAAVLLLMGLAGLALRSRE